MQTAQVSSHEDTIDQCVEYLCEQGCAQVNRYIQALQNGQEVAGLKHLSQFERQVVLAELVDIMSAYQGKCNSR